MSGKSLEEDLREALDAVARAAETLSALDVERIDDSAEALAISSRDLKTAILTFEAIFLARGEKAPGQTPAPPLDSFGPLRLKKYPVTLVSELERELETFPPGADPKRLSQFNLLGLYFKLAETFRFVQWLGRKLTPRVGRRSSTVVPRIVARKEAPPEPEAVVPVDPPEPNAPPLEIPPVPTVAPPPAPARPAAPASVAPVPGYAPVSATPAPRAPIDLTAFETRPEENGEQVSAEGLLVFHASVKGPSFAQRTENDDASCALPVKSGLTFAVASALPTSLGGRIAATFVTRTFCRLVATALESGLEPERAVSQAAVGTQQLLASMLRAILFAGNDSPALKTLRGSLPLENVVKILQNTLRPDDRLRHVKPALSATFVGGAVVGHEKGYIAHFVRVGPGAAEHRGKGGAQPLFLLGRGVDACLGPGPLGESGLAGLEKTGGVEVLPGDLVAIATAGLVRGHEKGIFRVLHEVDSDFERRTGPQTLARDLLGKAVARSEAAAQQGRRVLDDCMALALLRVRHGTI